MIKMASIVGMVMGLVMVFSAYTGAPEGSSAEAQAAPATEAPSGCVTREVALDEGYGVTRTETRVVCSKD